MNETVYEVWCDVQLQGTFTNLEQAQEFLAAHKRTCPKWEPVVYLMKVQREKIA